jgi:cold shock protein
MTSTLRYFAQFASASRFSFSQHFMFGIVIQPASLYMREPSSFGPNDLASPRAVRRSDDFIQNSNLNRLSCLKSATAYTHLKEGLHDARNRKLVQNQKGFGFIQPDDGSKDVFVHISAVERAGMRGLNEGQKVSFDVVTERGKSAAANLRTV